MQQQPRSGAPQPCAPGRPAGPLASSLAPRPGARRRCNKLKCYLNWLGHNTAHFNVGNYRRVQKDETAMQDASFFDKNNKDGGC
jgi:hypothetical protein